MSQYILDRGVVWHGGKEYEEKTYLPRMVFKERVSENVCSNNTMRQTHNAKNI